MLLNEKQKNFIQAYYLENKTLEEIAKDIGVPVQTLKEWRVSLEPEVSQLLAEETDRLLKQHQLSFQQRLRYLSELYTRLRKELDKRDFSGLPTDKLFLMMNEVRIQISDMLDYDDEDYDFDDWEDFDDDEYIP